MGVLITLIITIIMIHILVLAHEWGHYRAARRAGIPVLEFSIGLGWRLLALRRRETVYSLRIIPLGGYVLLDLALSDQSLDHYTPKKKIMVALGGPLINLGLALLIFIGIYSVSGIPCYSTQPVIGRAINEMPAGKAGIQAGDEIISVNGHRVEKWTDITRAVSQVTPGSPCSVLVQRNDRMLSFHLTTGRDESSDRTVIGVEPQLFYQRQNIAKAIAIGFQQTLQTGMAIVSSLAGLVTGSVAAGNMVGPIGLTGIVGASLVYGWREVLGLAALLSINLGIFNLLPIPFLDGGRILLAAIEAGRRRAFDPEKEACLHWLGLAFLMVLMLYASYNDIVRLL